MAELRFEDCEIHVFRSSGPGTVTQSAVRITHLPTGLVVSSENGATQVENRDRALAKLREQIDSRS